MIVYTAWLCELLLEALGAFFFFRRRIVSLSIWLGFRALTDFFGVIALTVFGPQAYSWCDYIQRTAQYALLASVSVTVMGMVLREHPKICKAYAGILCCAAIYAILQFHGSWPSAKAVLNFEIWAELLLTGFVAAAMGVANGRAPKPWGLIACALAVNGSSDLAITVARRAGLHLEALYPIGAITALAILTWAGWRDYQLEEVRVPLTAKKPVTSVYREFKQERIV